MLCEYIIVNVITNINVDFHTSFLHDRLVMMKMTKTILPYAQGVKSHWHCGKSREHVQRREVVAPYVNSYTWYHWYLS